MSAALCKCGCGQVPPIAERTRKDAGWVRGERRAYCPGHYHASGYEVAPNGCWLWKGALDRDGYPSHRRHRAFYELHVGAIPDGLQLDHLCHTRDTACPAGADCLHRRCVNPAHLEPVTNRENSRRGGARRTHCKHGHELTDENTYNYVLGGNVVRSCRSCNRRNAAAYKARRRARLAAAS